MWTPGGEDAAGGGGGGRTIREVEGEGASVVSTAMAVLSLESSSSVDK